MRGRRGHENIQLVVISGKDLKKYCLEMQFSNIDPLSSGKMRFLTRFLANLSGKVFQSPEKMAIPASVSPPQKKKKIRRNE